MKKNRTVYAICIVWTVFLIVFVLVSFYLRGKVKAQYNQAIELVKENTYESYIDAISILSMLGDYQDSIRIMQEAENKITKYEDAQENEEQGDYNSAIRVYAELEDFADCEERKKQCQYNYADQLYREKQYEDAYRLFEELGDYLDSEKRTQESLLPSMNQKKEQVYKAGIQYYMNKEYETALDLFVSLGNYEKSQEYAQKCRKFLKNYQEAISYFEAEDYLTALINFEKSGDYSDSRERASQCEEKIRPFRLASTISAGLHYSVALTEDGSVVCTNEDYQDIASWKDIISVTGFGTLIIGLTKDGEVLVEGREDYMDEYHIDNWHAEEAKGWTNIVQVAAGQQFVAALTETGDVNLDGVSSVNLDEVESWGKLKQISCGWKQLAGLDEDGRVHISGLILKKEDQEALKSWTDIISVSTGGGAAEEDGAGRGHIVGLRRDGTVVAVGDNTFNQCDVSVDDGWEDIIAISAGSWYTVGLRKDGTVISTKPDMETAVEYGISYLGACDVDGSDWSDIVAISAGYGHTVGVKKNGEVVAVGFSKNRQMPGTEDEDWKHIKVYEEWDSYRKRE